MYIKLNHLKMMRYSPPRVTEISVLSVETVAMRMCSGNSNGLAEVTHTWNRAEVSEYWIMSIRVFLSGEFDISPEDMFSETSSNVETSCQCVIA